MSDLRKIQLLETRLKALIETSKAVNSTSEKKEILEHLVRSALRAIPAADRGSIHFYDERWGILNLMISSFDFSRKAWEALSFQVGEGIAGWVFERQQPVISKNAMADNRYKRVDDPEVKPHRSMLCVPITGKREKIGVMSLSHSTDLEAFTPPDLDLLISFADLAAVAIENVDQITGIQKEAGELDFLRSMSLKINAQDNIEEILTSVLESGNQLLNTEVAVAQWRGRAEEIIQTIVVPAELQNLITKPRQEDGLTAEIFRSGESVVVPETALDTRVNPLVHEVGIQSLVGYPLQSRGRVTGVLFFNSRQRQFFGEHEIHLISLLLPQAAVAIENSNIIERLERTRRLSDSLLQVSSKLAATYNLEEQLVALKHFMQEELDAPMFYLGLYDEINDVIDLKIFCDECKDQELFSIPLKNQEKETISSFVVKNKLPIIWYSAKQKQDECQRLGIDPLQVGASCQTCLTFPLEVGGSILGVISIQNGKPFAWDEIEVSTFRTFAHQASLAIRNALLMQEINSSFEYLKNTYQASEKIISALEPDQALDVLVNSICTAVGAFRACATLINENGIPYHFSTSGFDERLELETAIREDGISTGVFRSGKPEFIDDTHGAAQQVHPKMIEQNVRAAACLPLIYKDVRLGVLWVHYDQPHSFLDREKEALFLFTNQAAIAYENAKLHQQVNKTRDTAMTVARITALGDLKKTLDAIVNGVKNVLGCDIVTLYTYRQEKDKFDHLPATAGEIRFPNEVSKTKTVIRSATPYKVIGMDDIYVAEDTQRDAILGSPFANREDVCSSVAAPLKMHDRRVGVLFINYCHKKHTFTKEELANIRLFAFQAAVAISNAMLYEDEQKRRMVLKIIDDAGRTVTGSLQLEEIFKNLAHQAYDLTGERGEIASFATISIVEGNQTILKAAYPQIEEENIIHANVAKIDLDAGVDGRIGIIGRVVKSKAPLLVKNVGDHPDFLSSNRGTNCELAVPIIYRDEVVGVINVEHKKIGGLDEQDQQDIQSLAAHAAVAILFARMYQALHRKSQHQQAMYEASKIITASLELTQKDLLDLLVKQMVTRIVPAAGALNILGVIHLYDHEKKELILECTYPQAAFGTHQTGEKRSLKNPPLGKIGISGRAVLQKKPQRVGDVTQDGEYLNYSAATKSELDVPMKEGETVLGVLSLECNQFNGFDKDAEEALCGFAELAVIAIQNTRHYQELKETRATVGNITAVAWMGLVAGAWRHSIGNMATTISDLSLHAQLDLIDGLPTEKINERLKKIQKIVDEIQSIPMPPLSSEAGVEPIYICQLVRDRINQFMSKKERYGGIEFEMAFEIDELTMVRGSPEWLRRILDILIDNARDAMKKSDFKKINTVVGSRDEGVEILVSDTGTGIPKHVHSILFKKPIPKKKKEKGSGLGLYLANTIIQVYEGRLEIRSSGSDGTTMALWLPLLK